MIGEELVEEGSDRSAEFGDSDMKILEGKFFVIVRDFVLVVDLDKSVWYLEPFSVAHFLLLFCGWILSFCSMFPYMNSKI